MNTLQTLIHTFPYGTKLTTEQLADLILSNRALGAMIQDLSAAPIEELSDEQLYGPAPRDDGFNDIEPRYQQQAAFDYGMDVGFLQYKQGFALYRKVPIDDLEPDMDVKLFILGVGYDVCYGDGEIALISPLKPALTRYIDTVKWELTDTNANFDL